jgi:hypothetical protein
MSEFKRFRDIARDRATTAIRIGTAATKQLVKELRDNESFEQRLVRLREATEAARLDRERQKLPEIRARQLEDPSFTTLYHNSLYQKWLKGNLNTNYWFFDPTKTFEGIRDGTEGLREFDGRAYETAIDPSISPDLLHEKYVEYCQGSSREFVRRAAKTAREFADGTVPTDEVNLIFAMIELIGDSPSIEPYTIFKDQDWHTSKYTPDYKLLGINQAETGVPEDQVMAGVELTIGLWTRLADLDARRPVSYSKFAPAMNHCSFTSLVADTGWLEYSGQSETFRQGLGDDDLFLGQFRNDSFFSGIQSRLS